MDAAAASTGREVVFSLGAGELVADEMCGNEEGAGSLYKKEEVDADWWRSGCRGSVT
jgi:hypothetical protein